MSIRVLQNKWRGLNERPTVRGILGTIKYFLGEKLLRLGIGFVLQTWMARTLGPELFGEFAYITDFIAVFVPLVLFGADEILMRDLVEERVPLGKAMGSILCLRLMAAGFSWLLIVLSIVFARFENPMVFWGTVVYGTVLFFRVLDTFEIYFQSRLDVRRLVFNRQGAYLVSSGLKLGGIMSGMGVLYFVFSYYLEFVLARGLVVWQFFREKGHQLFSVDRDYLKYIAKQCFPIAMTTFMVTLENRAGIFFLYKFCDANVVGQYAVALGLIQLWDFFPAAVCLSFFPAVVRAKQVSENLYVLRASALMALLFWAGVLLGVIVILVSAPLIKILYGSDYLLSVEILRWMTVLVVFAFLNVARVQWFIVERSTHDWLQICAAVLAYGLLFQWLLDPIYKQLGPIYASFSGQILGNLTVSLWNPRVRRHNVLLLSAILRPWRYWKPSQLIDQLP